MKKLVFLVPVLFVGIVFRSFLLHHMAPIPSDILLGGYYPWLEEKWGNIVGVGVKNNVPADVFSIIYPWRIVGMRQLLHGTLPLWDDTILLGVPLLANFQSAVLAPVNILFFLFKELDAWTIQIMLQPIVAVFGMYFFIKRYGVGRSGALFGGLLYGFSGYSVVWMEYNTIVYTLAFIPWIFLGIDELVSTIRLRAILMVGVGMGLQLLFGYPLMTIFTLIFGLIYLASTAVFRGSWRVSPFFGYGMGIVVGLGIAAVQLLPGMQLSGLSLRGVDTVAAAGSVKYLPVTHLLTFFVPDYFGHPVTANYYGVGSYENFAFSVSSVGILFLMIALVSGVAFRKKYLAFVVIGVLSLVYSLFHISFAGLDSAVNARVLIFFVFSCSVLAALGFQLVVSQRITLWHRVVPVYIYLIIILTLVYTLYSLRNILGGISISELKTNEFSRDLFVALRNCALPAGFVVVTFLVSFLQMKRTMIMIVFGLLLVSTVISTDKYFTFLPEKNVFPHMALFDYLNSLQPAGRVGFEKAEMVPANSWSVYGLRSPVGQDALGLLNTSRYIDLVNTGSVTDATLTRYHSITNIGLKSELYNGLDAKYFLALNRNELAMIVPEGKPFGWLVPKWFSETKSIGTVRVYENTKNLGPAWFGSEVLCMQNVDQMKEQMVQKKYTLATSLVLGCDKHMFATPGEVHLVSRKTDRLVFSTHSTDDNYLIVSQAWYPGWRAVVDGKVKKTTIANMALTGIAVPAGDHTVILEYRPWRFYIGLLVSVFTLLICFLSMKLRKTR